MPDIILYRGFAWSNNKQQGHVILVNLNGGGVGGNMAQIIICLFNKGQRDGLYKTVYHPQMQNENVSEKKEQRIKFQGK